MKKIMISIISLVLVFFTVVGATYAWLTTQTRITTPLTGSIFTNYFHCGSGTEQDPYVITKPQHLYNLTMLYQNLNGFDEDQVYIEIGCDGNCGHTHNDDLLIGGQNNTLDMSAYTDFVPIGTYNHRFKGILNGNNFIIDNLNIVGQNEQDVGVFGYVTDEAEISNIYFDNLTVDVTNCSGNSYVGYIAGYIDDATCFENVYVNNCELSGNANNFHCEWGYFGYCDNAATIEEFISAAETQGNQNTWGGSIAFDAFNQRLYHQLNPGTSIRYKNGNSTYNTGLIKTYTSASSSATVHRGGNANTAATYLAQDPASHYVVYNLIGAGTHKINSGSNGKGTTYTAAASVNGTYEPLIINDDYSTSDKNTGYLTSSNYAYGTGHYTGVDGTVRSASYPNGQIANSLDDNFHNQSSLFNSSTGGQTFTYDGSKLEILTNSSTSYSSGNYVLVSDTYNSGHTVTNSALSGYSKTDYNTLGLKRYASARNHLEQVLSSSQYVHGIHFMGVAPSASNLINVPNAIINGEAKTNYPVLLSSVDFTVKEEGYITLFAGAYYPATKDTIADSFFDLYKVNRNGDNITSIQKIYKIYKDANGEYIYTSSANQTVQNATLLFDLGYLMNQPPKNNVVYYFEIPVGAGEFAIGAVDGKTAGAYLMYLDLGANGGTSNDEVCSFESVEYRSNPDTVDHSILIIRYNQIGSLNFSVKVEFDKATNTYEITTSENIPITVVILDTGYVYKFNGQTMPSTIGQSNHT